MVVPCLAKVIQPLLNLRKKSKMKRQFVNVFTWIKKFRIFKGVEHAVEWLQNMQKHISPKTLDSLVMHWLSGDETPTLNTLNKVHE